MNKWILPSILGVSLVVSNVLARVYVTKTNEFHQQNLWMCWGVYYGTIIAVPVAIVTAWYAIAHYKFDVSFEKLVQMLLPDSKRWIKVGLLVGVLLADMAIRIPANLSAEYVEGDEDSSVKKGSPLVYFQFTTLILVILWLFIWFGVDTMLGTS